MSRQKGTPLAQALRLVDVLSDSDKATLRDYLRPEPAKRAATKKASKKARSTPDATLPLGDAADEIGPKCVACGNPESYTDHFQPSPHYHAFESSPKAKGAGK